MLFDLNSEQLLLKAALGKFLDAEYGFEHRKRRLKACGGHDPHVWQAFADTLGILGATLPESVGGQDGGGVETMIIMEALGEALVTEPYLETAILGAGLAKRANAEWSTALLSAIVEGKAVCTLAAHEPDRRYDLTPVSSTARLDGDAWVLNGAKSAVKAAPVATHVFVTARPNDGRPDDVAIFLVDKKTPGLREHAYRFVDGCAVSDIVMDSVRVPRTAIVSGHEGALPLLEHVWDEATVALCAEGVGVMRRMLRDTISYTGQRRQFGQPLSSFQVVQHRIADMYLALDSSASAAHLAALQLDAPPHIRARAASAAKVIVAQSTKHIAQNALQLHGGMGMSDELAISHYFRRATVLEREFGSAPHHLARFQDIGAISPAAALDFAAVDLSPEDCAFRNEVRRFLDTELPQDLREAGLACSGIYCDRPIADRWFKILARRGWSTPRWPLEHGGCGWSPLQKYIFDCELAEAGAPPLCPNAVRMIGPIIIAFGTEDQKRRYLPAIRSGDDYWAQGYSEPGAGSDLASLRCAAVRSGNHYVINGSKIWTTHAHVANRIFCLVRTHAGSRPQQGISFLVFDIDLPGIEIRPIISLSGEHELNEVFFTDVRVPVSALIGDENDGWRVAKHLLLHERSNTWSPLLCARLRRLRGRAQTVRDSALHTAISEAEVMLGALVVSELRMLSTSNPDAALSSAASSAMKIRGTELRQRLTELELDVDGPLAGALSSDGYDEGRIVMADTSVRTYLNDRAASIYAGANEVQRNILATQLLREATV